MDRAATRAYRTRKVSLYYRITHCREELTAALVAEYEAQVA